MKSIRAVLLTAASFLTIAVTFPGIVSAKPASAIDVRINIADYDVIYLTELFNVKTQKLASNVSSFSVEWSANPQVRIPATLCVFMKVQVRLRGGNQFETLIQGFSKDFDIQQVGHSLTAKDFSSAGLVSLDPTKQPNFSNDPLRNRLIDLAKISGTAPAGTYQIEMRLLPGGSTNLSTALGGDSKTIVIPYSSVNEAFVEITDPRDGSIINNLAPTFSWTAAAPLVTVRVYEAGSNHHSPQDALTGGNPHLVQDVSGATTLTYPRDATRQLEENKAYVLQIEAKVSTNRGEVGNFSRPVVFRISDDKVGTMLDAFSRNLGDPASASYTALRSDPNNWIAWAQYGGVTLDGNVLSEADLQALLNSLAGESGMNYTVTVENR